jgi:hypothetical protein
MGKNVLALFLVVLLWNGLAQASTSAVADQEYQKAEKLFVAGRFKEALTVPETSFLHPMLRQHYTYRLRTAISALVYFPTLSRPSAFNEQPEHERAATQYWIGFCCFLWAGIRKSWSANFENSQTVSASECGSAPRIIGPAGFRTHGKDPQKRQHTTARREERRSAHGRSALKSGDGERKALRLVCRRLFFVNSEQNCVIHMLKELT